MSESPSDISSDANETHSYSLTGAINDFSVRWMQKAYIYGILSAVFAAAQGFMLKRYSNRIPNGTELALFLSAGWIGLALNVGACFSNIALISMTIPQSRLERAISIFIPIDLRRKLTLFHAVVSFVLGTTSRGSQVAVSAWNRVDPNLSNKIIGLFCVALICIAYFTRSFTFYDEL